MAWYELTGQLIENLVILMSVEKGMVPLELQDTIYNHMDALQNRIEEYYAATR